MELHKQTKPRGWIPEISYEIKPPQPSTQNETSKAQVASCDHNLKHFTAKHHKHKLAAHEQISCSPPNMPRMTDALDAECRRQILVGRREEQAALSE
jgi:hypothetical protein